jgi:hypothetical protein
MALDYNPTDVVVCINAKGLDGIHVGGTYTVIKFTNCTGTVEIMNDYGKRAAYGSTNFQKK